MATSAYSQSKPLWHIDRISALRAGGVPVPVHVQLVLSDLCNQDCAFCAYRISDGLSTELFRTATTHNPNRRMAFEKAIEIVEDSAELGVRAVQFTGGGEPTVHPRHLDVFRRAQEVGLETALVTNAVRLDPKAAPVLAMRWIRVSVDAGTPETYARVRRVSVDHWSRVWGVLRALSERFTGRLSAGFVVTDDNASEIVEFVETCAANGVKQARVGAVFSERGVRYYRDVEAIHEAIHDARHAAHGLGVDLVNMFPRRIQDLVEGAPVDPFCGYQYLTTYIGADLGVYRCCNTAYTTRGKVADLTQQSFGEYLRGRVLADGFDARACAFCQFNGQNEAIASAVKAPDDPNFV